jgi:hypothetical protein
MIKGVLLLVIKYPEIPLLVEKEKHTHLVEDAVNKKSRPFAGRDRIIFIFLISYLYNNS